MIKEMTSLVDVTPLGGFVQSLTKLMRLFMQSNCKVHFGRQGEESEQLDIPEHRWGPNVKLMVVCWQQGKESGGSLQKRGALWNEGALSVSGKLLLA